MSINSNVDSIISSLMADTLVSGLTLTKSATYNKRVPGAYTPLTGAQALTDTTSTIKVVEKQYSASEVKQSNGYILESDKRFLLRPVSGVDPRDTVDDFLTISGRNYRIIECIQTSMGSTDLLWEVQCR
jgi:hypothetical protein|tara:strand:- start:87 stop:473 length:387 start_codon:yes stop_codon:yes gene_type:complete